MTRCKHDRRALLALGADRFSSRNMDHFTRDAAGAIDGFTVSTGRVFELAFRRVAE